MLEVRGMARDEEGVATAHLVRVGFKVRVSGRYVVVIKPGAVVGIRVRVRVRVRARVRDSGRDIE